MVKRGYQLFIKKKIFRYHTVSPRGEGQNGVFPMGVNCDLSPSPSPYDVLFGNWKLQLVNLLFEGDNSTFEYSTFPGEKFLFAPPPHGGYYRELTVSSHK